MSASPRKQVIGVRVPDGQHAIVCAAPEGLGAVRHASINIALWPRRVPQGLSDLLDRPDVKGMPSIRFEDVPVGAVERSLRAAFDVDPGMFEPLIRDVVHLARLYAGVAGEATLNLRLETIHSDACRRFHADMVRLRLLCTYLGPGTQWLPDSAVTFDSEGFVVQAREAALKQLERFEVGILKGRHVANACVHPAVHRSPPIGGTGTTRLLLCINEPRDP